MKKLLAILVLFLFITSCAGWSKLDKFLLTTGTVLNGIDILQTREIFNNSKYKELNPVLEKLGRDGATIAMISSNLLIYWFTDKYPKYRTGLLGIYNGVKVICVGNNIGLGVKIRF